MTTKNRIAEEVLLELNKRGVDANRQAQEVQLRVARGLAYLARTRYFISKANDVAEINGSLIFPFKDIKVELDEDLNEFYATLPATTMDFHHGLGISLVAPMKNPKYAYRPVPPGFRQLFDGLMSANLEGSIGYYQENNKIIFENMTGANNPDAVLIKMVLPLDGLDPDTPLSIPMDMQEECIQYIVNDYIQKPPKDITYDNVDQQ